MIISLLVAMDRMQGIGLNGKLPWHISSDLKRFKSLTMNHHVIMGRKTWESIARALPGRKMIVISKDASYLAEGCDVVNFLDRALELAQERDESEAFVIGGGQIFSQMIPRADKIYLTLVDGITPADTFFPVYNPQEWKVIRREVLPKSDKDEYATEFLELARIS